MLCVIAKLSPGATEKLRALRETAVPPEWNLRALYGHITLATYLPEDEERFIMACAELIRGCRPFSVRSQQIEFLPRTSIVVAAPAASEELVSLHEKIAKAFSGSLDQWTGGDSWHPHTTLASGPAAELEPLCTELQRRFVPFEAWISRIEFSRVEDTGYTILRTMYLI